jgi:ribosomal protein S2
MKRLKKIIYVILLAIGLYLIGFEAFYYVKNKGNVIFYVSNQSALVDTVDIRVIVDGKEVINDTFIAGNLHNFKKYAIKLRPFSTHEIEVYSDKLHVKTKNEFRFYFVNWVSINFWDEKQEDIPIFWFSVSRSLRPLVFM